MRSPPFLGRSWRKRMPVLRQFACYETVDLFRYSYFRSLLLASLWATSSRLFMLMFAVVQLHGLLERFRATLSRPFVWNSDHLSLNTDMLLTEYFEPRREECLCGGTLSAGIVRSNRHPGYSFVLRWLGLIHFVELFNDILVWVP